MLPSTRRPVSSRSTETGTMEVLRGFVAPFTSRALLLLATPAHCFARSAAFSRDPGPFRQVRDFLILLTGWHFVSEIWPRPGIPVANCVDGVRKIDHQDLGPRENVRPDTPRIGGLALDARFRDDDAIFNPLESAGFLGRHSALEEAALNRRGSAQWVLRAGFPVFHEAAQREFVLGMPGRSRECLFLGPAPRQALVRDTEIRVLLRSERRCALARVTTLATSIRLRSRVDRAFRELRARIRPRESLVFHNPWGWSVSPRARCRVAEHMRPDVGHAATTAWDSVVNRPSLSRLRGRSSSSELGTSRLPQLLRVIIGLMCRERTRPTRL